MLAFAEVRDGCLVAYACVCTCVFCAFVFVRFCVRAHSPDISTDEIHACLHACVVCLHCLLGVSGILSHCAVGSVVYCAVWCCIVALHCVVAAKDWMSRRSRLLRLWAAAPGFRGYSGVLVKCSARKSQEL